ncbi:hypothetical protein FALCPG4_015638 [Fusarium falciforme]
MAPTNFQSISITHVTTATALLDIDGIKLITDPVFDDGPRTVDASGLLPAATEPILISLSEPPALSIKQLPFVQGVLLSHEDHFDNLDDTGRQLLIGRPVFTTPDGKKNLSEYPQVSALEPWKTLTQRWEGQDWTITGVPCVHLPGGEVTGFLIHKESFGYHEDGRPNVFYFTGDTILLPDVVKKIRENYHVVVVLMNLGNAHAPNPEDPSQVVKITMQGTDAVEMFRGLGAEKLVPMHYEWWSHFTEDGKALQEVFESEGLIDQVIWLTPGKEVKII